MPHRKFNQLQDKFLELSKRMRESDSIAERVALLNELQNILKESKTVLNEIHAKQSQ
jgi:hypothetical protein